MPTKITTETQLLRLLANTPLQAEITFVQMDSHISKNTPAVHLNTFYHTFADISHRHFDGFIITGAPVEMLPFSAVDYWDELCAGMEWTKTNVYSVMHICWSAQAALYYHYGIEKYNLEKKLSGVYKHKVTQPHSRLMRGFDGEFYAPHSRYTTVKKTDILSAGLSVLSESETAGMYIAVNSNRRQIFITGHAEYDIHTLDAEYRRDTEKGLNPEPPVNYYRDDNPDNQPVMLWRAHAHLLFSNWLNYYVYYDKLL